MTNVMFVGRGNVDEKFKKYGRMRDFEKEAEMLGDTYNTFSYSKTYNRE